MANVLAPVAVVPAAMRPPPPPKVPLRTVQRGAATITDCEAELVGARADVMFALIADPARHKALIPDLLDATWSLVEDDGPRRKWHLDYKARWHFWRFSGSFTMKLTFETDSDAGSVRVQGLQEQMVCTGPGPPGTHGLTRALPLHLVVHAQVTYKLREPGFLRVYEGTEFFLPAGRQSLQLTETARRLQAANLKLDGGAACWVTQEDSSAQPETKLGTQPQPLWTAEALAALPAAVDIMPSATCYKMVGMRQVPKRVPPPLFRGLLRGQVEHAIQDKVGALWAMARSLQSAA